MYQSFKNQRMLNSVYQQNRQYYHHRIQKIVEHIEVENLSVLDLGCGECLFYKQYAKVLKGYYGIDNINYSDAPYFHLGNVLDFSLWPTEGVDLVLCLGLLDHMSESDKSTLITKLKGARFSKIIISQQNPQSLINRLRAVFKRKTSRPIKIDLKGYKMNTIYLLKFPFTQAVFKVGNSRLLNRYLATEKIFILDFENS